MTDEELVEEFVMELVNLIADLHPHLDEVGKLMVLNFTISNFKKIIGME